MKLLFDQNLAPSLASRLADIFPESAHVQDVGLDRADDAAAWNYTEVYLNIFHAAISKCNIS